MGDQQGDTTRERVLTIGNRLQNNSSPLVLLSLPLNHSIVSDEDCVTQVATAQMSNKEVFQRKAMEVARFLVECTTTGFVSGPFTKK